MLPGPAVTCAYRALAGQHRLPGRGERCFLLVPGEHPLALLPANRLGYRVQGIAGNAPDPLDPVGGEVMDGFGDRALLLLRLARSDDAVSLGGRVGWGQRFGGRVVGSGPASTSVRLIAEKLFGHRGGTVPCGSDEAGHGP